ncbi:Hypothetical predicted protein [Mytilus galloprovincialis]|uniref:Roc domain-containing protein n=1 Tax=Mytilus galloprovincialis TaxID=29158 RepID=A0A8B6F361_MYTGA|nr:Hypothetical predicted protein [Mytilus galloprovincialis]
MSASTSNITEENTIEQLDMSADTNNPAEENTIDQLVTDKDESDSVRSTLFEDESLDKEISSVKERSSCIPNQPYAHLDFTGRYAFADSDSSSVLEKQRKESIYSQIRRVSGSVSSLRTTEHLIPDELLKQNKKSVEIYKDCLKFGEERRNKVRIILVGPKGSGKTSLLRRLLRQPIVDVKSTNGVEIHISKCKARLRDMKWICRAGSVVEEDVKSRLLQSIINTYKKMKDTKRDDTDEEYKNKNSTDEQGYEDILDSNQESDTWVPSYQPDSVFADQSDHYEYIIEPEDRHDLFEILNAPLEEEDSAFIDFWDFAGDKEYYNTHKAFLSKDAIYIVTFDVSKNPSDVSLEDSRYDLKFWLETIRCYGTDHSSDDDITQEYMYPSVFIVGTHKDRFKVRLKKD